MSRTLHEQLMTQVLSAWSSSQVDHYSRKNRSSDLQPSLFEHETQPHLEGLGPGRWITIGAEDYHGHHVFVGTDGKMKTGKFAGQSMDEAFGGKSNAPEKSDSSRPRPDYDKRLEDLKKRRDPDGISTQPVDAAERTNIPYRDRKAFADEMAANGATQSEIAEAMMKRGVAAVDARRHASDAMARQAEKQTKVTDNGRSQDILDDWSNSDDFAAVLNSSPRLQALDKAAADEIEKGLTGEDGTPKIGPKEKAYLTEMVTAMEGKGHDVPSEVKELIGYQRPKAGIIEATKPTNEEAKPGDQLGLFGDAERAKPAGWKPSLLDFKGKQTALFDTKGDPDQKLLFQDGVTPDDMVYQPEDKSSPAAAFDDAVESGKSPREAAEAAQKKLDAEYEFARASSIGNAGEDLKGSARHRVNAWKGLAEAEKDGTAAELVTRDQLAKLEPHNLMMHAEKNPLTSLVMHYAMRAFPPKPGTGKTGDHKKDREQYLQAYRDIKAKAEELAESGSDNDPIGAVTKLNEYVRSRIDQLRGGKGQDAISRATMTDRYNQTANDLVNMHRALITGFRANKTGVVGRLNDFAKAVQQKYGKTFDELRQSGSLEQKRGAVNVAVEHAKDIIEGHSLNKTFGKEGSKAKRFDPAELYVKVATRTGGRDLSSVTSDANKATKHLVDTMGLRGVQWGNSVTDEERKHHAGKAVEALTDLADALGVHPKDIALDGKLGLAVGARGRGGAVAHYEPDTRVINLTRKNGVGSLAHEWAHAFDHFLVDFRAGDKFMSKDTDTHEVTHTDEAKAKMDPRFSGWKSTTSKAEHMQSMGYKVTERPMSAIRFAFAELGNAQADYRRRLSAHLKALVKEGWMTHDKARKYWESEPEIFARTFERYVQHKIESEGRKSTYLAGIETKGHKAGGLWPTDDEVKAMAPAFDKLFEEYRKHKHGSTEKVKFSRREALNAFGIAEFVDVYARRNQKSSDLQPSLFETEVQPHLDNLGPGRWITIGAEAGADGKKTGGRPVFVDHDGEMKTGKFAGQTMAKAFGKKTSKPVKPQQTTPAKPPAEIANAIRATGKRLQQQLSEQRSQNPYATMDDEFNQAYADALDMIDTAKQSGASDEEILWLNNVTESWIPYPSKPRRRDARELARTPYAGMYAPVLIDRYKLMSEAQREAGNYRKEHIRLHGLAISIETKKGQRRDPAWPPMPCDYGYVRGTMGRDGDHVDVFLGPDRESELVVVIDQVNENGSFDEHKCLLGFTTTHDAIECYKSAYTKGWKVGPVTTMTIGQFKAWLELGDQAKQLSKQVSRYWNRSIDDDLRLDASPLVDRYEWNASDHPRVPAGSQRGGEFTSRNRPGGTLSPRFIESGMSSNATRWKSSSAAPPATTQNRSGRVTAVLVEPRRDAKPSPPKSSKKRMLAERPLTIQRGHPLHLEQLDPQTVTAVNNWSSRMREVLQPMDRMPTSRLSGEEQEEAGWAKVDKKKVRELLAEMNQMNREAESRGVKLYEFINANGVIQKRLAERLDGGSRFFDPEKLGSRLRSHLPRNPDQELIDLHPDTTFSEQLIQKHFADRRSDIGKFLRADETGRGRMLQDDSIRTLMETLTGKRSPPEPVAAADSMHDAISKALEGQPGSIAPSDRLTTQARNKLDGIAGEVVGDGDAERKQQFMQAAIEAWKIQKSAAEEHNNALREITGFIGKHHGALAANIARGIDVTRLRGFDELVDHAQRHYPQLLAHSASDSETGSAEEGLVKALRKGILPVPQPWHDEVINQTMEMLGPSFFGGASASTLDDSWDAVPFSVRSDLGRMVQRYWARNSSLLAAV